MLAPYSCSWVPQVNPMFARVNQKGEILNPELAVSEVDTAGAFLKCSYACCATSLWPMMATFD